MDQAAVMLDFVGWTIFLVVLTAAAPLAGLGLGLLLAAMFIRLDDAIADHWDRQKHSNRDSEPSQLQIPVLVPRAFQNLPGKLLHQRQRPFRIECVVSDSGKLRAYTVLAKHAGAAIMKARLWGERVGAVEELGAARHPSGI